MDPNVPGSRDPRLFAEMSEDDPDIMEIWLDGEVISTLSYDEIGYSGQSLVRALLDKISAAL
jgi:hypothetical protein